MEGKKGLHNFLQTSLERSKIELEEAEEKLAMQKVKNELLEAGIYKNYDVEIENLTKELNSIIN
ncbi:MAG: hypothetical protein ACX93I_10875 [Winogradskyella sp.]